MYIILCFGAHKSYVCCWLARLTRLGPLKLYWLSAVYFINLIRRISSYMCQILFIWKGPTSFGKHKLVDIYTVRITQKRTSSDMELRNYPKPYHLFFFLSKNLWKMIPFDVKANKKNKNNRIGVCILQIFIRITFKTWNKM